MPHAGATLERLEVAGRRLDRAARLDAVPRPQIDGARFRSAAGERGHRPARDLDAVERPQRHQLERHRVVAWIVDGRAVEEDARPRSPPKPRRSKLFWTSLPIWSKTTTPASSVSRSWSVRAPELSISSRVITVT